MRHLPNVLLVHFEDLKRDMEGEIRRIAAFLAIAPSAAAWPRILEHASFEHMKKNAAAAAPLGGAFWEGSCRAGETTGRGRQARRQPWGPRCSWGWKRFL